MIEFQNENAFKREDRYMVIKRSDYHKYLSEKEIETLCDLCRKVSARRRNDGRQAHNFVVIQDNWEPEFSAAWKMIENRVHHTHQNYFKTEIRRNNGSR